MRSATSYILNPIITTKSRGRQSGYSWHRCILCRRAIGVCTNDGVRRRCGFSSRRNTPSDFAGMQYVDSKGCAFIRVGFSGPARWVPRVTRQRLQMCGLSPTVISNTPTKVARAQPEPNSIPVEITFDDPIVTASSVARPAKPQRGEVASFGGALTRMFRSKPAPKPIARVNATPMRTTVTDPILRQPTTKVIRPGGGELKVLAGYKIAWNDDRLNPNRGVQKVSGMIQTTKHWTNTVPRKHRNVPHWNRPTERTYIDAQHRTKRG